MREKQEGRDVEEGCKARSAFACPVHLACLACLALLVGCGYQFRVEGAGPTIGGAAATSSPMSPPPRSIVRTLENKSFEPNLETRYTNYPGTSFRLAVEHRSLRILRRPILCCPGKFSRLLFRRLVSPRPARWKAVQRLW